MNKNSKSVVFYVKMAFITVIVTCIVATNDGDYC